MNPRGLYTLFYKELLRFAKVALQTLMAPVITSLLYLLIFSHVLAEHVQVYEQVSYTAFLVPGLIMMSVITNSYGNVVSSFFGNKFQRSIEELMVSPTPEHVIIGGFVAGGMARGILVGIIVSGLSLFFADLNMYNVGITFSIVILTAVLFSLGGFINAVYANSFDDISIVPTFVLTPLTYLGGIFYTINMLPDFWQKASLANPILYMVNAFRYGFLGITDINLWISYGIIIAFIVVLYYYSMRLLNKGIGIRT